MTTKPASSLKEVLAAGAILSGASNPSKKAESNVSAVLKSRLLEFHHKLGVDKSPLTSTIPGQDVDQYVSGLDNERVESVTGAMALWVVESIHKLLADQDHTDPAPIGIRDLAQLRMLVAIVFRWGTEPRLSRLLTSWLASGSTGPKATSSIVEVTDEHDVEEDYRLLKADTLQVLGLLPLTSKPSTSPVTIISSLILPQHTTPLLRACIALGWGPQEDDHSLIQEQTRIILQGLPSAQAIASLGTVMAQYRVLQLRKACSELLTRQLLEPEGVRGLFSSILGESDDIEPPLIKLETIARVLSTVPADMSVQDYYEQIIPRTLAILSPGGAANTSTPPPESHKKAAAFGISKMLTVQSTIASETLSALLHAPFAPLVNRAHDDLDATPALETLQAIFARSDPSPLLPKYLITPILAPLYALLAQLDQTRTSDPALKELVRGLLRIWARTVDTSEAVTGWWNIINYGNGWGDMEDVYWEIVGTEARVRVGRQPSPPVSLQATFDIDAILSGEGDKEMLGLKPSPSHLVSVIKSTDRKEVASAVCVRALNEYEVRQKADSDPLKTLLYLRLIMEMVEQLGSTALTQPEHILSFVAHALRSPEETCPNVKADRQTLSPHLSGLRIVDDAGEAAADPADDGNDSDDEGAEDYQETALNLLLATLEANETLTPLNTPLLQVILSDLEPLTLHDSPTLRALAREARLVLTARNASSSNGVSSRPDATLDPRAEALETYQKALKLLQDPLLPVRAHGLVLLRHLIVPPNRSERRVELDPALVPGILSVFLQSVQEDDSYIFLNAVQGLVAMVDVLGQEILNGLVDVYAGGLLGGLQVGAMSKADLDRRLRVGEALNQSIRRCGDALSIYINTLVPPFFQIMRSRHLPTTLRTSALSLLARCAETSPKALLPWTADLCAGLVELLQLEASTIKPPQPRVKPGPEVKQEEGDAEEETATPKSKPMEEMDVNPLSQDSKLAPFRRSALHFLAMLLRATAERMQDTPIAPTTSLNFRMPSRPSYTPQAEATLPADLIRRLRLVLNYTRATDTDPVVKVMAGEVLEVLAAVELGI